MDTSNTSLWMNNTAFLQNVFNDTSDLTKNDTSHHVQYSRLVLFYVVVLGIPGNILVIAIYVANMSTSTRVYLFALALVDTAICICSIVLAVAYTSVMTVVVFMFILNLSLAFSILLLVFVSIERLIAVRRPHTFNMNPKRAKKYLIVFLLCAVLLAIANGFASYMNHMRSATVLKTIVLIVSALIIVTCYSMIGVTLLKKAMASRYQIAAINIQLPSKSSDPSPSSLNRSDGDQSAHVTVVNKITAKQTKHFKSMFLLFIISVVFIACWFPLWLQTMGADISNNVTHVYVVNSVVNPFIYGMASAMFREDVRQFYRQTRAKLSACVCMCTSAREF